MRMCGDYKVRTLQMLPRKDSRQWKPVTERKGRKMRRAMAIVFIGSRLIGLVNADDGKVSAVGPDVVPVPYAGCTVTNVALHKRVRVATNGADERYPGAGDRVEAITDGSLMYRNKPGGEVRKSDGDHGGCVGLMANTAL